ncbi:MAG: hypothetical protein V4456_11300 [Bacteroidota bacterium]
MLQYSNAELQSSNARLFFAAILERETAKLERETTIPERTAAILECKCYNTRTPKGEKITSIAKIENNDGNITIKRQKFVQRP